MKIKLAILDREPDFLERLASAFNARYWDKLEIYSFTQLDTALSELSEARIDVFLADESFEIDLDKIPTRCGFAYFVENPQIASLRDQPAISKYQKADSIYKQILSIMRRNRVTLPALSQMVLRARLSVCLRRLPAEWEARPCPLPMRLRSHGQGGACSI